MRVKRVFERTLDVVEGWWSAFYNRARQTRVWSNVPVLAVLTVGLLLFIVMVGQQKEQVVAEPTPTVSTDTITTATPHVVRMSTPVPEELDKGWLRYWAERAADKDGFEALRETEQWERHVATYEEAFVAVNELCADSSMTLATIVEHEARMLQGGMDDSDTMVGLRLRLLSVMWSELPESGKPDCSEWLRSYLRARMP